MKTLAHTWPEMLKEMLDRFNFAIPNSRPTLEGLVMAIAAVGDLGVDSLRSMFARHPALHVTETVLMEAARTETPRKMLEELYTHCGSTHIHDSITLVRRRHSLLDPHLADVHCSGVSKWRWVVCLVHRRLHLRLF